MRYVVITGVSRGLGEALLNQLLTTPDTTVLALGRSFTDAQRAAVGQHLILRGCDLADPDGLPGLEELAELLSDATEVVLLHNAATVEPIGPIGQLDPDDVSQAVAVNLTAPMLLTNTLIAALPPDVRRVRVLYVSSGAAHRVIDGWSIYSATKRGSEEFFTHLAEQYAEDDRFSVAIVNPGVMDTDMQSTIRTAHFAGQERFIELYERGELPAPAVVATKLIDDHVYA
jgi:NAD(P)-dependent dehydrogenase (short-subunit alcohol dehydrogenase family)